MEGNRNLLLICCTWWLLGRFVALDLEGRPLRSCSKPGKVLGLASPYRLIALPLVQTLESHHWESSRWVWFGGNRPLGRAPHTRHDKLRSAHCDLSRNWRGESERVKHKRNTIKRLIGYIGVELGGQICSLFVSRPTLKMVGLLAKELWTLERELIGGDAR